VALLEKRRFLYNHSGDFPQVILIVPSHVPNNRLNFWAEFYFKNTDLLTHIKLPRRGAVSLRSAAGQLNNLRIITVLQNYSSGPTGPYRYQAPLTS
jgi:hypothetical protein